MSRVSKRPESNKVRVLFRTSFHRNVIKESLLAQPGWKETESDTDWDFNWADTAWIREFLDHMHLDEHQRINHFRNFRELTRKDLLVKNVKRMRKQLARSGNSSEASLYNFVPESFVLPSEYGIFVEAFKRTPGVVWIMKPIGRAQGKGIFLITKLSQIKEWKKGLKWKDGAQVEQPETYIVQRYVENPYLIGGKKFDLRLYVLVTSFSPLTVWVYRSGFARFSSTRYSSNMKEISNLHMHLTNVSIQKKADDYSKDQGCKWDLRELKLFLLSKHGSKEVGKLFADIQSMILRSLFSVENVMINDKHCFELYGFDVMIDDDLKPWLIEVNASPSLTAETPYDHDLKFGVLEDLIAVVDVEGLRDGSEKQVGGFDLVWDNGPIKDDRCSYCSSFLGAYCDRETVEKRYRRRQRAS
eukprot:TRINITY_DN1799_c0_g2_i1.p1 TRINITY_DN1799_c0_g2~~TRINITY_DN1799_c0_g2_i1.p1  ORF type:complete len:414 (+),score=111.55 TRINITY_DN1799_c0_g2_i1:66-1307(+)